MNKGPASILNLSRIRRMILRPKQAETSEIGGEYFSRQDVLSSIRNNPGPGQPVEKVSDNKAEGIV